MNRKRTITTALRPVFVLLLALALGIPLRLAAESGDTVVVVYNKRMPESKAVADHYATLRQVPARQVVGFDLPTGEVMTRADFKKQLQTPLFDYLLMKDLFQLGSWERSPSGDGLRQRLIHSPLRYIVLCHGVPLRIAHDDTLGESAAEKMPPELRRNGAAVDSELAWLPLSRENVTLSGFIPNPFYGAMGTNLLRIQATNGVMMVARLDGPTADIARGLVDKALEGEKYGLWGRAYFDSRGLTNGAYVLGDEWIRGAAKVARQMGFETVLDTAPGTFSDAFPMSQIAIYAGWYAGDVVGPFARKEVEFVPGAFAYHLHSFSAATLRSTTRHWVGPLLAKGATVTVGAVDEPYLAATPDVAMLMQNLLQSGASFGEAAYSADRGLSWQTTVVGDPLYRPFGQPLDLLHRNLELRYSRLAEWSHLLVVNRNRLMGTPTSQLISYIQRIPLARHSAVLTEKLGDLHRSNEDLSSALKAYQEALERFPSPAQKVRLLLQIADLQAATGREKEAMATLEQLLREDAGYPSPLEIYKKLLALARQARDTELEAKYQAAIARLTPPPPSESPKPN